MSFLYLKGLIGASLVSTLLVIIVLSIILIESGKSKSLNNIMFGNVGKKIKGIAKFFTWLLIFASLFASIFVFIQGTYNTDELLVLIFIAPLILIVGCLTAWLSFICLYGFGELIDKISDNKKSEQ